MVRAVGKAGFGTIVGVVTIARVARLAVGDAVGDGNVVEEPPNTTL